MDINITLIEQYFDKIKYPVTVFSSTDIAGTLIFQAGKPEEVSSIRIPIDTKDLLEILYVNKIIGAGSAVEKILKEENGIDKDERRDNLIYTLLVNYIYWMLTSSRGINYDESIIPLEKHRLDYFTFNKSSL